MPITGTGRLRACRRPSWAGDRDKDTGVCRLACLAGLAAFCAGPRANWVQVPAGGLAGTGRRNAGRTGWLRRDRSTLSRCSRGKPAGMASALPGEGEYLSSSPCR
jgi:hypothetical protein